MSPKSAREFVSSVSFLGNQCGDAESLFLGRLVERFRGMAVSGRFYLLRVVYPGEETWRVALCAARVNDFATVEKAVAEEFAMLFTTEESLDVILLSSSQEQEAQRVGTVFYDA